MIYLKDIDITFFYQSTLIILTDKSTNLTILCCRVDSADSSSDLMFFTPKKRRRLHDITMGSKF